MIARIVARRGAAPGSGYGDTPSALARRLGLGIVSRGKRLRETWLTFDDVTDLAAVAYWHRRPCPRCAAVGGCGCAAEMKAARRP